MTRFMTALLFITLVIGILILPAPSIAGPAQISLTACTDGGFSTEEDFMMIDGVYVSDGDLLSFNGQVCARNADLLANFYPNSDLPADLGLDAVDILDIDNLLVAFSTELDDPGGNFTAGDLLLTNGAIIPNAAFVNSFDIKHDIGFDAVHFVGEVNNILDFADVALELGPDGWGGGRLQEELSNFDIDIWFSIEGTHPPGDVPDILDGDLLSATGTTVFSNGDLLPGDVPAGIPMRGVDFGLDAATTHRLPGQEPFIQFSTEILYRGERSFNDGDVLLRGNGVITFNEDLIQPFQPAADFLGLDALSIAFEGEEPEPHITHIGNISVGIIDGGNVPIDDPGTGLANVAGYERPFGRWVPIHGDIPVGISEFRVVYRVAGTPRPFPPDTALGIAVVPATGWQASDWNFITNDCSAWSPYDSNADGWFNAAQYRRLEQGEGMPGDCNAQLALTVWNSNDPSLDTEGHYVIWLQWRENPGDPTEEEPFDHHVQFDNQPPGNLALGIPGGACSIYGSADMPIMVQGHIEDPHFLSYRLQIFGGNPPASHWYPTVNYDDSGTDNVGPTGTIGAGNVDLHVVDVNDLPAASVTQCAYGVTLRARDRTIVGGFTPGINWLPSNLGFEAETDVTFNYAP